MFFSRQNEQAILTPASRCVKFLELAFREIDFAAAAVVVKVEFDELGRLLTLGVHDPDPEITVANRVTAVKRDRIFAIAIR